MSFETLGLSAELLRAIRDQGYNEPTPVQRQAIPVVLKGSDMMVAAQTGTGKTAGFTLPLLQRLALQPKGYNNKSRLPIRALILTPTRELAAQVSDSVRTYGKHLSLKSAVVFGGVNINPQISKVRYGVDILVATPGRLLDLVERRVVNLSSIEILVLDEADRMLDMGFLPAIRQVIELLPKQRQNLLFSATFSAEIKALANKLMRSPELIEVARSNATAEGITQIVHPVDRGRKRELLSHLISSNNWYQVLVFARAKHGTDRLAEQLQQDGLVAIAIHGDKSQGTRTRALADFKRNKAQVLVATDVAARGLDINKLPHVVNFDLPDNPEDYIHRIGRTGRAQNEGTATSLVAGDEFHLLRNVEKLLKCTLPQVVVAGFEPDPSRRAPQGERKSHRGRNSSRGSQGRERQRHAQGNNHGRNSERSENNRNKRRPKRFFGKRKSSS